MTLAGSEWATFFAAVAAAVRAAGVARALEDFAEGAPEYQAREQGKRGRWGR